MWCKVLLTAFERRNVAVKLLKMRESVSLLGCQALLWLTSAVTALSGQPLTQANTLRMPCSRAGNTSTRNWPYLEHGVYTVSSLVHGCQPSFCCRAKVTKAGVDAREQGFVSLEWLSELGVALKVRSGFHYQRRGAERLCTDLFILKASTAATHVGSMVGRMK